MCRNYFVPVIHFEGESYRFVLLADGSPKSYRIQDPKLTLFKPEWTFLVTMVPPATLVTPPWMQA